MAPTCVLLGCVDMHVGINQRKEQAPLGGLVCAVLGLGSQGKEGTTAADAMHGLTLGLLVLVEEVDLADPRACVCMCMCMYVSVNRSGKEKRERHGLSLFIHIQLTHPSRCPCSPRWPAPRGKWRRRRWAPGGEKEKDTYVTSLACVNKCVSTLTLNGRVFYIRQRQTHASVYLPG